MSSNTARQESADGEPDSVVLLGDFNVLHQEGDKTTDFARPYLVVRGGVNAARRARAAADAPGIVARAEPARRRRKRANGPASPAPASQAGA